MALDREGLKDKLDGYVAGVEGKIQEYFRDNGYTHTPPDVEVEHGPKYVRIWKVEKSYSGEVISKSIHTFVNRENGDILKPAGWKGPVKNGKRGNVFDMNYGLGCVNWNSTVYLR